MNTNYTLNRKDYKELCAIDPDFKEIEDDIESFFDFNEYLKGVMRTDNDQVVNIASSFFFKKTIERAVNGEDKELSDILEQLDDETQIMKILIVKLAEEYGYEDIENLLIAVETMVKYFN